MIPPVGKLYGNGEDGVKSVSGSETLNTYKACVGTATQNYVTVASGDEAAFTAGDLVLIIKMRGETTTAVGTRELATVSATSDTKVTLTSNLVNTYQDSGDDQSQIILVPQYTTFSCPTGQTLTGTAWNATTGLGGVIAIMADTSITINAGTITGDGLGYKGGAQAGAGTPGHQGEGDAGPAGDHSQSANGTGGGGGDNGEPGQGGGGGGFGAAGSASEGTAAAGGTTGGAADMATLIPGGAGGSGGGEDNGNNQGGAGGDSGLIIFLMSKIVTIENSADITNAGASGSNGTIGGDVEGAGGGGGGSGGAIWLQGEVIDYGTDLMDCTAGAKGSGSGNAGKDGGAGAVGRIRVDYATSVTGSTSTPAASENEDSDLLYREDVVSENSGFYLC